MINVSNVSSKALKPVLVFNDTLAFAYYCKNGYDLEFKDSTYGTNWKPAHVLYATKNGLCFTRSTYSTAKKPLLQKLTKGDVNWELFDEQKLIEGYVCKKAVAKYKGFAGIEVKVTVWYTTDLGTAKIFSDAYSFFPGIVLELIDDINNIHFIVDTIEKGSFNVSFPRNAKILK